MNYYIIAGEASGDLHASNLMKQIKVLDTTANFRCWGGDLMKEQGGVLVKHYRDLAFMGFTEVILNLRTIVKNIELCKVDIFKHKPDVLILVDYPGFNLRIAEYAKKTGIKVVYYISPQVWAWKQSRVHKIKRVVDKMLVILPFEKDFYKQFNFDAEFVGHPLLDAMDEVKRATNKIETEKPIIAILPGSRKQEIEKMLPLMLSVKKYFENYQFVVAGAPSQTPDFYKKIINDSEVKIVYNDTYNLLSQSYAALVTSGTATLETALFGVPEVVCYKGGKLSFQIAKRLVKVKYISLVNLILDNEAVKELIQDELTTKNIQTELAKILTSDTRENILIEYANLKQKLGVSGASKKAATSIVNLIK